MEAKLTKNFKLNEFVKRNECIPMSVMANLEVVAKNLQVLRDELGQPIIVTSGYRDRDYNKKVGGVKYSFHTRGMAVDFYCPNIPIGIVYNTIKKLQSEGKMYRGGLILYTTKKFIHYDIRLGRYDGIVK